MNSNKIFYILAGLIVTAIFITVILILKNLGGGQIERVTLDVWGVFDSRSSFEKGFRNFQLQYPNITLRYQQFAYEDYEKALIDALAAGSGPDVIMVHNSWLPKHQDKLAPLPAQFEDDEKFSFTIRDLQDQFVDVVAKDLTANNQIYGLPLYVDTLALYYNKDMLNSAGITRPPQTWQEVNDNVIRLTRLDDFGNIVTSGLAMGTARNINRSTDILTALMIQSGVQMNDENGFASFSSAIRNANVGETALQYYTDFANPQKQTYAWNDSQHYSVDAFLEGRTAMILGYAHQMELLKAKAPRFNFGVSMMPQASLTDIKNYANYWTLGVSNASENQEEAWKFVLSFTSKENITDYLNETQRPAARRDLIELQRTDPDLGLFAIQALSAKSWYQWDNVAIENIFADMIDNVNYRRLSIREALQRAESQVNVLKRK